MRFTLRSNTSVLIFLGTTRVKRLRMIERLNSNRALGTTCVTRRRPSARISASRGPITVVWTRKEGEQKETKQSKNM